MSGNSPKKVHENQLPIDSALVQRLINAQFPQYAGLPLTLLGASGSSNVLYRLGEEMLVRLPRLPDGGQSILKEHRWLPLIAGHLTVAVPELIALGEPSADLPEHWAIVSWLDGNLPAPLSTDHAPTTPFLADLARDLADLILALRAVAVTDEARAHPALRRYRGGALAAYDPYVRQFIEQCRNIESLDIDLDAAQTVWEDALKLPGAAKSSETRTWYHADLVRENLLIREGRLHAVLDWGELGVGDPAIDLHGAWEVLDSPARGVFRERMAVTEAEWLKGRAWALAVALCCIPYYQETMPGRVQDRLYMARSVLADAAGL